MREILFKAKRKDDGEWVEGYYMPRPNNPGKLRNYIVVVSQEKWYEIVPETLCQYTGIKDKNSQKIWENDIIKHERSDTTGAVKWFKEDYVGWCVDDVQINEQQFTEEMWNECDVIGNIFDDPELITKPRLGGLNEI